MEGPHISSTSDPENSFVCYWALLNAKFKKLVLAIMVPAVPDKFVVNVFQYNGGIGAAIPGKIKGIIPLVNFICKPFLQANRGW